MFANININHGDESFHLELHVLPIFLTDNIIAKHPHNGLKFLLDVIKFSAIYFSICSLAGLFWCFDFQIISCGVKDCVI